MNDIKKLYDASTSKDELAEVAEKLGIEDKSLAGILKEIAGGMINVPTVTQEELNSGVLTQERYDEFINSGIIRVNGDLCVVCSDAETTGNVVEQCQGSNGALFTYSYCANSNGVNTFSGYLVYTIANQPDKRFISYVDV